MNVPKCKLTATSVGLILAFGLLSSVNAYAGYSTTETQKYLVIATGNGDNGYVFDANGVELGADQEVVSSSKPGDSSGDGSGQIHGKFKSGVDLYGDFTANPGEGVSKDGNRWVDADSVVGGVVGPVDYLPGAKNLSEAPDYSGNVAITHEDGQFVSENSDYFASIGINCQDADECFASDDKDNSWNQDGSGGNNGFSDLAEGNGVFDFDASALLTELSDWQSFIDNLEADMTLGASPEDLNYKSGTGPLITDLDAIDNDIIKGNMDGYAVIDIVGESGLDFIVNNTDWILRTTENKIAIFRMARGGNFQFKNSSIMMGCTEFELDAKGIPGLCQDDDIDELGAIFYTSDKYKTYKDDVKDPSNTAFDLSNVILGGIGLWDLDSQQNTYIDIDNAQGCTQLISSKVDLSSSNRFNRCALTAKTTTTDIPEPSTIMLFAIAMLGLGRRQLRG